MIKGNDVSMPCQCLARPLAVTGRLRCIGGIGAWCRYVVRRNCGEGTGRMVNDSDILYLWQVQADSLWSNTVVRQSEELRSGEVSPLGINLLVLGINLTINRTIKKKFSPSARPAAAGGVIFENK